MTDEHTFNPTDNPPEFDDLDEIEASLLETNLDPQARLRDAGLVTDDVGAAAPEVEAQSYNPVPRDTDPNLLAAPPEAGIVSDEDDDYDYAEVPPPTSQRMGMHVPFNATDALVYWLLAVILLAGGWLRFDAQNWDDFTHLHPDERFLTDVVSSLGGALRFEGDAIAQEAHRTKCETRYPLTEEQSFLAAGHGGYFDAECSPLNPNNVGKGLYVYGEFPLFTVHAAGVARSQLSREYHLYLEAFDPAAADDHTVTTYWETYTGAQFIGRSVAALADWLTILVLFLLGRRLYGRWQGLLAAALYAFAAFPIQQSHFWTVDAFTTFWVTLALYFAVRAMDDATTQQGPLAWGYLALWAGAVTWDAAYQGYSMLGLATLGGITLGLLGLLALLRLALLRLALIAWLPHGERWGDGLIAGTGVMASVVYMAGWQILNAGAVNEFTLINDINSVGIVAFVFGLAVWIAYIAADFVRRQERSPWSTLAVGAVAIMWTALVLGYVVGDLSPWATLLLALGTVALLIFDLTGISDYAWFGVAFGGAVASRVNMAPLAGVIILAAMIKALPVFDEKLSANARWRLLGSALMGLIVAGGLSLFVFRLLQPHAFIGPNIWNLGFNPGWQEDISQAAYFTSGDWDAPPNHQWANRIPYLFPWRNIVLWGFGIPLGLTAWIAWGWAGVAIFRGRRFYTRHLIPFAWVLVVFGWLGGRWVTTMRYFLPIYPALAIFAAWALIALVREACKRSQAGADRRAAQPRSPASAGRAASRLAVGATSAVLVIVLGYTALYGFAFHNIERQQLTRVAASRWFQETVPGDLGLWVEGDDGTRQLVSIGRNAVATPPTVSRLEQGESVLFDLLPGVGAPITLPGDAVLTRVIIHRALDPLEDAAPEALQITVYETDPGLGRFAVFSGTINVDMTPTETPYGASYALVPDEEIVLPRQVNDGLVQYSIEIAVSAGGPVTFVRDVADAAGSVAADVSLGLQMQSDRTLTFLDFNFDAQPLLTGHGDDIPETPTHWTVGGSDIVTFTAPINGEIRELEIPHLGDPLKDAGAESVTFILLAPDGTTTRATVEDDFNAGADPLGPGRTITFDPPLRVETQGTSGEKPIYMLTVEAHDPIYTSGPVMAWEGSWDDPVPWPTCPLPDDMVYRDDLPSGLSRYTCPAVGVYNAYYQGIHLWMFADDTEQKHRAMINALDQADYLVITSNRFYDSLSRNPARFPLSIAFYDALFDDEIGFELVRTFKSQPTLGPFTIPDQILPTDNLPDFLNEHWEAEEAFHVYDHPIVLVFRKTDDYSPEKLRAVLDSVPLRSINMITQNYITDPEPVGVIPWGAKQASEVANFQQFDDEKWDIQQEGGTWSDLFDLDSLINRSQAAAVIVWWTLIIFVGWLAWPLLYALLPALPDRGYPMAKFVAWLIVAWLAWFGGTFNLLAWTRTGIALLLVLLALTSGVVIWRRRAEFRQYIRLNWPHLLATEALTLVLFSGFLWVRAGNPDLWHGSFGGEKPMDFAYFNGVLRSTVFPPISPWASGEYINYYYFGYVIVGAPVKLIGIDPAIAYNLIIPTLYAMTGIGVFSVAYNWVRARYTAPGAVETATRDADRRAAREKAKTADAAADAAEPEPSTGERRAPAGSAWFAGLAAVLLAVVLGNLATLYVFVTEVAELGGHERPLLYHQQRANELEAERTQIYGDFYADELVEFRKDHDREPDAVEAGNLAMAAQRKTDHYIDEQANHPPIYKQWAYDFNNFLDLMDAFGKGLPKVLAGEQLPMATHRWHWAPTRIIADLPYPAGQSAITEMPYFTFLYGDLHAHMMAFPITLFVLVWLLSEIIGAGYRLRAWWESGLALALGAVAVGVLRPTNSWDWITYMLLGVAGLTYVAWVGATRRVQGQAPSALADWLWKLLLPHNVRNLLLSLLVVPVTMFIRVGYYALQIALRHQQDARGLQPGEKLIEPSLTTGSVIMWVVAAVMLVVGLYVALLIMARARMNKSVLIDWIARVALFVAMSVIAALPFTMYFVTGYNSISPWENDTTPLWTYLYVNGMFVFIVISFLIWQTARYLRMFKVRQLQGLAVPVIALGSGLSLIVLGGIVFGARDAAVAQLVVPLVVWASVLFFLPEQNPLQRITFALIVLSLAITLGVELVVLDGDIGRQNTVFKFYLQVWVILSIVGGVTLAWMFHSFPRWNVAGRLSWQMFFMLLLTIALAYPLMATRARWQDRFDYENAPRTLDGMEYMTYAIHGEYELWFPLKGDYDMIRWLQQNVKGTPVIMEAHFPGVQYHWSGRISIYTGLPTMLGWSWHQIQQHSAPGMDKLVHARENNASAFYELSGAEGIRAVQNLSDNYDVEYIVVGALERAFYGDIQRDPLTGIQTAGHSAGLAKFDTMVEQGLLTVVYDAPHCIDYGVTNIEECDPAQVYNDRIYKVNRK